jgi:hypothetical protein
LLTCSYNNQEFFRVGYYVNNYYEDPEMQENPPLKPDITKLVRHILVEKPRVTKFQIDWDDHLMPVGHVNTEGSMMSMMQTPDQAATQDGLLSKGSQFQDRNDMMSSENLAQAAQNFQLQ